MYARKLNMLVRGSGWVEKEGETKEEKEEIIVEIPDGVKDVCSKGPMPALFVVLEDLFPHPRHPFVINEGRKEEEGGELNEFESDKMSQQE